MSEYISLLEYPISVIGKTEYWKLKPKFKMYRSRFPEWIMIAIEEGRFSYRVDDIAGEASSGDIVLIPPNAVFIREIIDPLSFFYIRFLYSRNDSADGERIRDSLRDLFGYKFAATEQDRLFSNFRHLFSVYNRNDQEGHRWTTHFVSDMWSLFYMEAKTLSQHKKMLNDSLMKDAKDWIDRYAFKKIQLKEIALEFGLHPVQLTRRFQKTFGFLPSQYLISVRMEKAKQLLIQTDFTLEHVARLCGYDNGYYFSRMFTQYTKMNPSIFRRVHAAPSL
jgi:AraC-like DNA-binding protein